MLSHDQENDFNALLPGASSQEGASRRTALKAALGMGYAAAALPVMAQTAIKTSSEGLRTEEITYEVNAPMRSTASVCRLSMPRQRAKRTCR